tara:strand:+ start:18409 stop:19725 length:1317 start_codon:yes stop_codon:yes gene_type:complete
MNSHLSYFKPYSKTERDYQLEDDLTRAFALCLKRDPLLLHEVLKYIMKDNLEIYNRLFNQKKKDPDFEIDIQRRAKDVEEFEVLFAVSLTGVRLDIDKFNSYSVENVSDQRPDMYIRANNVAIIFEAKPNDTDCSFQLYKQTVDAITSKGIEGIKPIPVDLNWRDLMEMVVRVANFENTLGLSVPLVNDFINLIKRHKHNWLPEIPFNHLDFGSDVLKANERLETAMEVGEFEVIKGRLGFEMNNNWSRELLFEFTKTGLAVIMWPANTKTQGKHILHEKPGSIFQSCVSIQNKQYPVEKYFHIKISDSYAKYISSINGDYKELKTNIYKATNFWKYSGRKDRNLGHWDEIENFFDQTFEPTFDWREKANWKKLEKSNMNRILVSFGHQVKIEIPYEDLRSIDDDKENIQPVVDLLMECKNRFENILVSADNRHTVSI